MSWGPLPQVPPALLRIPASTLAAVAFALEFAAVDGGGAVVLAKCAGARFAG